MQQVLEGAWLNNALLEQQLDAIVLSIAGGIVQRCVLVVVRCVDIRAEGQEHLDSSA